GRGPARAGAEELRAALRAGGWPEPVLADSGNGCPLLYRVDLPADDGGLVRGVLRALARRFDTDAVAVDTAPSDAVRICKLYGTVARKGADTPDRPHRRTRVLDVPEKLTPVPESLLKALAAEAHPAGVAPAPLRQA